MNSQQVQDIRLMYEAVYDDELREKAKEYNSMIRDEDIVEVATEYFYTYGLNENGIDILIEKVGLDNFVEFVYDLSEDLVVLTEARAARKRTSGKSYEEVKAEIDAKEAKKAAKKKAKKSAEERKETERKEPESRSADTEAKAEQPKSKKPIRDAIARQILAGIKRHREATQTAGNLARETGKTLGKLASVTHEAGRRAGEHVKKHGLKSLANEEFDNFDIILEYLVAEGYADTNQSALVIMANMSEEWKQSIVEQRVDVGGGRTVGPVAGAVHSLLTGNLPKSRTYIPPSTQTPTNRAPSIPASKGDSGKLTDFGAGGGREKMKKTGMTVGQVERQGRMNRGDYSG